MSTDLAPSPRRCPAGIRPDDRAWWLWCLLAVLLAADVAGLPRAREAALFVAVLQAGAVLPGDISPRRFRSQVRLAYAIVLALSFLPGMLWLSRVQLCGTLALILVGYCPLARSLLLLPLNRSVGLSWRLVRFVVLSPPTSGSIRAELERQGDGWR